MGLNSKELFKDDEENKKIVLLVLGLTIFEVKNTSSKPYDLDVINNIIGDVTDDYYGNDEVSLAFDLVE